MKIKAILITTLILYSALSLELTEQSSLQSHQGNPAQNLIDHLSGQRQQLLDEETQNAAIYAKAHADCGSELTARKQNIIDGNEAYNTSVVYEESCKLALKNDEADLAQIDLFTTQIDSNLRVLRQRRTQEAKEYADQIIELDNAILAVRGAYPLIEQLAGQQVNAFIQLQKHAGNTFFDMLKVGKSEKFLPVILALAQIQSKDSSLTPEQVQSITLVFDNLLNDLITSEGNLKTLEDSRIEIYTRTVADFTAISRTLSDTKEVLNNHIQEMEICIKTEEGVQAEAYSKVRNNENLLQKAQTMCDAYDTEWNHSHTARIAEIEMLRKLIEYIKEEQDIYGDFGNDEAKKAVAEYRTQYQQSLEKQTSNFIQLKMDEKQSFRQKFNQALSNNTPKHLRRQI